MLDIGHGKVGWRNRRQVARFLADIGYDQAIVLPNSFKSAVIPFWAKIPKRTGWIGESRIILLNDRRKLEKSRYPLMIERFMALGLDADVHPDTPYPLPRLRFDAENAERLRGQFALATSEITVLCPGAEFGPAKQWPAEHFATVARHAVRIGDQVWLVGSPKDVSTCGEIEQMVPTGIVNLAGKTSLVDAVDLIALADRVVCNDSGLMHVACALDCRVIAVFGSTSPGFTPPLGDKAHVVRQDIACSPCFQRECPLGHLRCLKELDPSRVIEVF